MRRKAHEAVRLKLTDCNHFYRCVSKSLVPHMRYSIP